MVRLAGKSALRRIRNDHDQQDVAHADRAHAAANHHAEKDKEGEIHDRAAQHGLEQHRVQTEDLVPVHALPGNASLIAIDRAVKADRENISVGSNREAPIINAGPG